jgi:hypothetical protein
VQSTRNPHSRHRAFKKIEFTVKRGLRATLIWMERATTPPSTQSGVLRCARHGKVRRHRSPLGRHLGFSPAPCTSANPSVHTMFPHLATAPDLERIRPSASFTLQAWL